MPSPTGRRRIFSGGAMLGAAACFAVAAADGPGGFYLLATFLFFAAAFGFRRGSG